MDLLEALFYRVVLRVRVEKRPPTMKQAQEMVRQEARWLLATLPKILQGDSIKAFTGLESIRQLARRTGKNIKKSETPRKPP